MRAKKTAELEGRRVPIEQLTDEELMRIAAGHFDEPERRSSKLLLVNQR